MSSPKRKRVEEEDPTIHSTGHELAKVSRSIRDVQPGHYLLKIKSFSVLAESEMEKYESDEFETGGYKWKLYLYPNGKKDANGNNYISLYLAICDASSLPQGWEVNVHFKLFVYDHIKDKYLTIQGTDGSIRRFHVMKTEWGFDELLPLNLFKNPSNGYLFEDSCVFGAEVLVIKYSGLGQCLDIKKVTTNFNSYTWKIEKISSIKEELLKSVKFKIGELEWMLIVYPKGNGIYKGESLSLFLTVANYSTLPPNSRVYAEYKLGILSEVNRSGSKKLDCTKWFVNSTGYGYPSFILLSDLNDKSKGYIVNDTLVVEVEINIIGVTNNVL
ncbi:hypothetical protein LguiB_022234 [Lonicera macranthoides]